MGARNYMANRPQPSVMARTIAMFTVPGVFAVVWLGALARFVANPGDKYWDGPVMGLPRTALLAIIGVLLIVYISAAVEWTVNPTHTPTVHKVFVVVAQAAMLAMLAFSWSFGI